MQPRLELGNVPLDDFETYKHQPALIESTSVFPLSVDEVDAQTFEIMSALEAEAEARADSGKLLLLFEDTLAVTYHGSQVCTRWLTANHANVTDVTCFRSPVTSMALAKPNTLVVSLASNGTELPTVPVLVLRISPDGMARVVHETSLQGKRIFLSTASMEPDDRTVKTLAYRPVRSGDGGHVELLAVQMELAASELRPEAKILWTACGPHPPQAAHWSTQEILLVSLGGFVLQPDATAADVAAITPPETEDAVLTIWTPRGLTQWPLPRELLSAQESEEGVQVALSDTSGAALLLDLAASALDVQIPVALALPGAAACATARRLRAFVVAPKRDFFVLLDDQHGVSIYRTPCGALASPMASLSGDGPVHALRATAGGCVVLRTRSSILLCKLNLSARVESVKRPLISREQMPLGMDPQALLKMLDARGED